MDDWIEIASADDDVIADKVLRWSGCREMWDERLNEEFDFVADVLVWCDSASVDQEVWDGGAPGQSGTWHVVSSNNPNKLKAEIRSEIEKLLRVRS